MLARVTALSLCLVGAPALAADNGFYLGPGVGASKLDITDALDKKDTGYKFTAGFRLLDSFGVEASYADLGKASLPSGIACIALVGVNCPSNANVSGKATSAFAVGFLDFPLLDVFAKAGVSRVSGKFRVPGVSSLSASDSTTDLAWGMGLQAHFLSFGVRAEFERFKVFEDVKTDLISVSVLYTFL
jgi:hypothetical protein